jgi:hypothetical protein
LLQEAELAVAVRVRVWVAAELVATERQPGIL